MTIVEIIMIRFWSRILILNGELVILDEIDDLIGMCVTGLRSLLEQDG